jgi:hypothetical protein
MVVPSDLHIGLSIGGSVDLERHDSFGNRDTVTP